MEGITIGQLAHRAGVKVSTVRVYERHGLLARPSRTDAGYRVYQATDLDRLVFIRRAKELGVLGEFLNDRFAAFTTAGQEALTLFTHALEDRSPGLA